MFAVQRFSDRDILKNPQFLSRQFLSRKFSCCLFNVIFKYETNRLWNACGKRQKRIKKPPRRKRGQQSSTMVIPWIFCPSSGSNQRPNMGSDTVKPCPPPPEMFHLNPSNVSSQGTLVHPVMCCHSRPNVPSQRAQSALSYPAIYHSNSPNISYNEA